MGDEAGPIGPLPQVLQWIGFNPAQATRLHEEFGDFDAIEDLSKKDINNLATSYASRPIAAGRIHFGLVKTKRLQSLVHWVADFGRINEEPTIVGLARDTFLEALKLAQERAEIRASEGDTAQARAKEASPGKLKSEKDWDKWEPAFENQLSVLPGVSGVPLLYVIREEESPDQEATYATFQEHTIAACALEGPRFEADSRQVHQLVQSYTTGENSEQWLKPVRRLNSGREDMKVLRAHYRGEGNTTRRIGDAERLRDTLHYKSEGAMPFGTFLSKCQNMFNMFVQVGEPYTDAMQTRFLLEKIQNAGLKTTVEAIKSTMAVDPSAYNFTKAANHLSAQVQPSKSRTLGAVGTGDIDKSSIMKNGKINTGYYKNWNSLSLELRSIVMAERDRAGIKSRRSSGQKEKGSKNLRKEVKALKAKVAALKRAPEKSEAGESTSEGSESDSQPTNDAGNAVGGRAQKAKSKKKAKRG